MSKEDQILEKLTSMQEDMAAMKADIEILKLDKSPKTTELSDKIQQQLEAIRTFSRANTPEEETEIEAFIKFMDAEEERKNRKYALLS